ncbi:hypothetical protein ACWDBD_17445 [Streptomyces sp. NPDC001118]
MGSKKKAVPVAKREAAGRPVAAHTKHVAVKQSGAERPKSAVRDLSSAKTGSSIFGKADAGNRRLGRT